MASKRSVNKSAISGRFVTTKHAKASPKTTYRQTFKGKATGK